MIFHLYEHVMSNHLSDKSNKFKWSTEKINLYLVPSFSASWWKHITTMQTNKPDPISVLLVLSKFLEICIITFMNTY